MDRLSVVEEPPSVSLAGWTLNKMDMASEWDAFLVIVHHLNTDLAAICEQLSCQVALQSELGNAQNATSPLEARRKSVRQHSKAIEFYIARIA